MRSGTMNAIIVLSVVGVIGLLSAGCSADTLYAQCEMAPSSNVDDRAGNLITGSIDLRQRGDRGMTEIRINLSGFNTNDAVELHGFHIHEFGDMSDACTSMGDHYNPLGANHGDPNNTPFTRHVGDLGNIRETAGSDTITSTFNDYLVMLSGDYSVMGRGMIVHANADDLGKGGDEDSLKTGNAGSRAACCVIGFSDGSNW